MQICDIYTLTGTLVQEHIKAAGVNSKVINASDDKFRAYHAFLCTIVQTALVTISPFVQVQNVQKFWCRRAAAP